MTQQYEKICRLWQSYEITTAADLDRYLENFRILFAFHSGKIENPEITYHDTREIFENGKLAGFSGSTRTVFEQQNQRLCYEYLKEKIAAKEPVSIGLILEMHRILTSGTYDEKRYIQQGERPGEFKQHDYVTGQYEVGSAPEDVQGDLEELLSEVEGYAGKDALKVAAYFHARFEYIHPFADGNGRVGRTLLNYYLMIKNHPPIIVYEETKSAYYKALEAYDKDESLAPMYDFLKGETVKTWENTLARAERRREKEER